MALTEQQREAINKLAKAMAGKNNPDRVALILKRLRQNVEKPNQENK